MKVNISIANVRLFVGNIPKNKSREEIKEEFGKRTGTIVFQFLVTRHYRLCEISN